MLQLLGILLSTFFFLATTTESPPPPYNCGVQQDLYLCINCFVIDLILLWVSGFEFDLIIDFSWLVSFRSLGFIIGKEDGYFLGAGAEPTLGWMSLRHLTPPVFE